MTDTALPYSDCGPAGSGRGPAGRLPAYPSFLVLLVRIVSRLSFFVLGLVILYLSLKPSVDIGPSDKLMHLLAYGAWTFASVIGVRRWRWGVAVALGIVALGGVIELLQPISGRIADWGDFLANSLGVLCGGLLTILARSVTHRLGMALFGAQTGG